VDCYISTEIALALEQWFKTCKETVREVFLEKNGLKDEGI